uniref:Uncharacterized protein n=1 Tax=Wuchereria bancrofti TaxID=6293 RepID=A0AAF5PRJ1_WUCBA
MKSGIFLLILEVFHNCQLIQCLLLFLL